MGSWKCEVYVQGEWNGNSMVFATREEAEAYGHELLSRWMQPTDSRAVEATGPATYVFRDGRAQPLVAPPIKG